MKLKFGSKKFWKIVSITLVVLLLIIFLLTLRDKPEKILYGMSFNVPYARELGLDWQQVYLASMDDLGIERFRLAAHWPIIEPEKDQYNFSELDFQIKEAERRGVEVILAVGRRLPRWPECHVPDWAKELSEEEWQAEVLEQIELVVKRYQDYENIAYWQVENEPYLSIFAYEHCGDLDKDFLKREISLVRALDDSRPILVTDSGNLGTWIGPYRHGDAFGTSVYLYFWNPHLGKYRTLLPPDFYKIKANLMEMMFGHKETILIELATEPWLIDSVVNVPIDQQLERMDLEKINDIISYAEQTRFEKQYLWGVEWWYWMKEQGHPEFWDFGRELFQK